MSDVPTSSLAGVEERLDRVASLLAAFLTMGMARKDQVVTLSGMGFQPKEVAGILGISAHQVSVTLYDAKQAGKQPYVKGEAKPRGKAEDKKA